MPAKAKESRMGSYLSTPQPDEGSDAGVALDGPVASPKPDPEDEQEDGGSDGEGEKGEGGGVTGKKKNKKKKKKKSAGGTEGGGGVVGDKENVEMANGPNNGLIDQAGSENGKGEETEKQTGTNASTSAAAKKRKIAALKEEKVLSRDPFRNQDRLEEERKRLEKERREKAEQERLERLKSLPTIDITGRDLPTSSRIADPFAVVDVNLKKVEIISWTFVGMAGNNSLGFKFLTEDEAFLKKFKAKPDMPFKVRLDLGGEVDLKRSDRESTPKRMRLNLFRADKKLWPAVIIGQEKEKDEKKEMEKEEKRERQREKEREREMERAEREKEREREREREREERERERQRKEAEKKKTATNPATVSEAAPILPPSSTKTETTSSKQPKPKTKTETTQATSDTPSPSSSTTTTTTTTTATAKTAPETKTETASKQEATAHTHPTTTEKPTAATTTPATTTSSSPVPPPSSPVISKTSSVDDIDEGPSTSSLPRPAVIPLPPPVPQAAQVGPKLQAIGKTAASYLSSQMAEPGMSGLNNLGNTCFMNCILQCLAHTPELWGYFGTCTYEGEINTDNPLGTKGALARAFAKLLDTMWNTRPVAVDPSNFKDTIEAFAPQFAGYHQHDAQEFLAYLLDGLHEDLNRIKKKPYVETKDHGGRPDWLVAQEAWGGHKARNDSFIVDLFHGQYRSTVTCGACHKDSITFDPFMYLSLPLPHVNDYAVEVVLVNIKKNMVPMRYKVMVPSLGFNQSIKVNLSRMTGGSVKARDLILCTVVNSGFVNFLKDTDKIQESVKRYENVVVFVVSQGTSNQPCYVLPIIHRVPTLLENKHDTAICIACKKPANASTKLSRCTRCMRVYYCSRTCQEGDWKEHKRHCFVKYNVTHFPFLLSLSKPQIRTHDLCAKIMDALTPFMDPSKKNSKNKPSVKDLIRAFVWTDKDGDLLTAEKNGGEIGDMKEDAMIDLRNCATELCDGDEGHIRTKNFVGMEWKPTKFEEVVKLSNVENHSSMRGEGQTEQAEEVTLDRCMRLYTENEELEDDDAWFCPHCKKHQAATKALALWRLPKLLVVHLKRFAFSRYRRHKLDAYVDFPETLDLTPFMQHAQTASQAMEAALRAWEEKHPQENEDTLTETTSANPENASKNTENSSHAHVHTHPNGDIEDETDVKPQRWMQCKYVYELYGVANHEGSMAGGHYTAAVVNAPTKMGFDAEDKANGWCDYNDRWVRTASLSAAKTRKAYVLFYRLKEDPVA